MITSTSANIKEKIDTRSVIINMCGRFTLTVSESELIDILDRHYGIDTLATPYVSRYNIAPSQDILSMIHDGHKYRVGYLKWGLIPHDSKHEKMGFQMINAKSETLLDKKMFLELVESKRCIILSDGFYEWKKVDGKKQPYRIFLKDQKVFAFAGLRAVYQRSDGTKVHSATILTTQANDLIQDIHDRMPVILDENSSKIWLNPNETDLIKLTALLKPYDADRMSLHPVSPYVNRADHEGSHCIENIRQ